jgi:hypothetical protein
MWIRWRRSRYTLHPWDYMTNIAYADDMVDMECLETVAKRLERAKEERDSQRESRAKQWD